MKKKMIFSCALAGVMAVSMLTACGTPANNVFSVDDLPGKIIGVQQGTTGDIYATDYEEPEDPNQEKSTVERYNKGADAIQALKQGKIDCVIIDNEPAKVYVSNNDDLKILDDPFAIEDYAIAIKQGNDEMTTKINEALKTLKSNGTLDSIIANYIGDDAGKTPYTSPADTDRSKGTITMATNAEFPPYEYKDGDKVTGIDADMMQAVCDILGYELKIEDMSFDSIISSLESGQADVGVAGMTVTEDRLKSVDFTDSYTTATQVIVVRKN